MNHYNLVLLHKYLNKHLLDFLVNHLVEKSRNVEVQLFHLKKFLYYQIKGRNNKANLLEMQLNHKDVDFQKQ